MLSVRDLHAGYGGKNVLHGVSLEVPRGEIVTLLGANGAGKSTLLKTIVGLLPRTTGTIELDAVPLPNAAPDRALKAGVALVPEQRELVQHREPAGRRRRAGQVPGGSVAHEGAHAQHAQFPAGHVINQKRRVIAFMHVIKLHV